MTTSTATRRKATTRRERPQITAEQARRFTRESLNSYGQIVQALEDRRPTAHAECRCEPYVDTFTFGRWIPQGFHVRKGEKAIRLATWVPVEGKEDDDESAPYLLPRTVFIFCRCQVDPNEEKGATS